MSWLKKTQKPVILYVDGSCLSKKDRHCGGWGVVILHKGETTVLSGIEVPTTNNRMELRAAIVGLQSIAERSDVYLYTDSRYVKDGIQRWLFRWRLNSWLSKTGEPVKNADLWKELDLAVSRHRLVSWNWVKGHKNDKHNNMADKLASRAAREHALTLKHHPPLTSKLPIPKMLPWENS